MIGQFGHRLDHRRGDGLGGVIGGQVQQDGEPGGPFDQGADRAAVAGTEDQIAFPVPGHGAIGGLGGTLD